jgi:hypothetical protein
MRSRYDANVLIASSVQTFAASLTLVQGYQARSRLVEVRVKRYGRTLKTVKGPLDELAWLYLMPAHIWEKASLIVGTTHPKTTMTIRGVDGKYLIETDWEYAGRSGE